MTRFWHGFTAHYNTYYNGTLAYIDASVEKENGNKDNFTEQLPLYTVGNKASRDLGKSNYDKAITKCEKAIQLHSIKVKPKWTKERKKTEKDIAWLKRKEYNPFLWKAWILMGRSQFYKGEFDEAAATFSYMSRLYKGQPAIYGKAQAWLAKCYIENGWLYNAEDVIRNISRDSIDWRAKKEWDYTLCDYYLHTGELSKASQYLRKVIKHEMRSKQRAREYYILGQIEAAQGHRELAYKAFHKVLGQHPDYEHRFNANIAMTEVMATGQSPRMISRLKRMAHDDNNKDYLDQIYYAIGNIYLADKDTTNAIVAYEKGNKGATRSGIEKGVLLLHLGDLYWAKEKFSDAKRCYGEAIGLLDKERPDYEELSNRSKVLDELVPYTDAIHLQDSLQELSRLPKEELNKRIDLIIDALKKKEKEEANKKWEEEQEKNGGANGNSSQSGRSNNTEQQANSQVKSGASGQNGNNSTWYFYSTASVQQGKQAFIRQWGKRENKDDWQRSNKTVVGDIGATGDETATTLDSTAIAKQDSITKAEEALEAKMDTAANDPHKREYYLAQIPFTDEAKAESDKLIKDGLFHSAIIFKDKLNNLPLAEKAFRRLERQYPDFEPKDEAYYHLFLLYSRKGEHDKALVYVDSLKAHHADSKWTAIVTDPYFYENARYGKQIEDSLYGATYEAFKADSFQVVYKNVAISKQRFSLGENRDRFIFLYGMTKLNDGDIKECLASMDSIVQNYPESAVSEMAGMIINGVKAGKRIYGAQFNLSDVWNRRTGVMEHTDSLTANRLSPERNTDFLVLLAYNPDSLNENQLLFQLARYNFTSFLVRNFDITIDDAQGMHHMTVSGFRNFDEARQYAKILSQQENIKSAARNARMLIISDKNLQLLGQQYSYNDYDTFYVHHFEPLTVMNPEQLYEPVSVKKADENVSTTDKAGSRNDMPKREKLDAEGNPIDNDPVKPILPDEQVAPQGVRPEEPQEKVTDNNDDRSFVIPSVTEQKKDSVSSFELPAAPELKKDSVSSFELPAAPELKKDSVSSFELPAAPEFKKDSVTEDTFIIDNNPPKQKQATDDTIIIEDAKQTKQKQATDDTIIIEDAKQANQKQATDDTIIIEDAKQSLDKVEDEYYELDGF